MNTMDESQLVPELGDLLTIISDIHKSTTGRIIYRDGEMIRIRPSIVSDRAIDFPLNPDTGLFLESLGVSEVILHEKAKYPHYARQLGVLPGEVLEFYGADGTPSADPGTVASILADDTQDAIQLEDGRILNFGFLGPTDPYTVIVPRSAPEDFTTTENNTEPTDVPIEDIEELPLPEIELPAPLVEEIPTSERTYSDAVQREDMFVSLLLDIPQAKQKNPRILRNLYRKTDLLLALKNSMVLRDEQGSVLPNVAQSYIPTSVSDLLTHQVNGTPVAALLPVADVKKVVYTDDVEPGVYDDVDVRADVYTLLEAATNVASYKGQQVGNPFLSYMDFLLSRNLPAVVPRSQHPAAWIQMDQDVLRSRVPPAPVQGFPADLPEAVAARKDETVALTSEFLATVQDRSLRLVSATKFQNRKTGLEYQIAPADSADVVDHILLSADLLELRAPTRSSVLLWDIQASEASRRQTAPFYAQLMAAWDQQRTVQSLGPEDTVADILRQRIPPTLALTSRPILHVLDTLGMRTLELNSSAMDAILAALTTGQAAWKEAMEALRGRALAALSADTVSSGHLTDISDSDPLWSEGVLGQEDMAGVLGHLKDREPTLFDTQEARTAYFLTLANGTLLDVWYAVAAALESKLPTAIEIYRAERRRLDRATANARAAEAALAAVPTLNSCQHVYLLESIRSIREESRRYAVFQDFLTKYQSGVRGNWVICGSCDQTLVCRHELLLLHEFLHPGRSVALHKTLLLEFSGPVFEGAYICKNCGQKIADLEFDTHLEFDDEGRPLVGRTIVNESSGKKDGKDEKDGEEGEETGEGEGAVVVLADEAKEKDGLGFKDEDLKTYYVIRTVLEHCGISPTRELYLRMVAAVRQFMAEKVPSAEYYNTMRRKMEAEKKPLALPLYEIYVANTILGCVGALTVLELQTADFAIPFPAYGCKLERGGFPLETDGMGAITYVTCVIAGVLRNDAPWNQASWSQVSSLPKRQAAIASDIKKSLNLLLAIGGPTGKAPPPITTITEQYTKALEQRRLAFAETGVAEAEDHFLSADRIPHAFRPIPGTKRGTETTTAVTNVKSLQRDVAEGPLVEVKAYVSARQQDVIQETLAGFHATSLASAKQMHILSESNPRSDAACCFQRLGAVALVGHGLTSLAEAMGESRSAEIHLLEESARRLRQRDPAASSNGTHIYVPWSAPLTKSILPQADPSMYYKLFVKNCFRGDRVGFPHEYGLDWVCRHCKYACPPELEYLTGAELGGLDGKKLQKAMEELEGKRQALAIGSLEGQVSEESFHALEDAIHIRTTVHPYTYPKGATFSQTLEQMGGVLQGMAAFGPRVTKEWVKLQQVMQQIEQEGLLESARRRKAFSEFVTAHDTILSQVGDRMIELLGARPTEAMIQRVQTTLEGVKTWMDAGVGTAGSQAARNLQTFFVAPMMQIATGYRNEKPQVKKWFPKVAKSHKDLLTKIWDTNNAVVNRAGTALEELKEAAQTLVRTQLQQMTQWLGPWTRIWTRILRPTNDSTGFTASESMIVLRWSFFHMLGSCLMEESPFYATATPDVRKVCIQFFNGFFLDSLRDTAANIEKMQLTVKQIQEALLARQELERAEFIRRFDVLDRDMRRVELMKKRLKIGDWAVGTMKNLFQYDADFFEFERGQRAAMGLPEFAGDITGDQGAGVGGRENPYGFMEFGREQVQVGVNDHRATHDEDA